MAEHPATHFEVMHVEDGWRTACGSNGQSTTGDPGCVTCLRCMNTRPFVAATTDRLSADTKSGKGT